MATRLVMDEAAMAATLEHVYRHGLDRNGGAMVGEKGIDALRRHSRAYEPLVVKVVRGLLEAGFIVVQRSDSEVSVASLVEIEMPSRWKAQGVVSEDDPLD